MDEVGTWTYQEVTDGRQERLDGLHRWRRILRNTVLLIRNKVGRWNIVENMGVPFPKIYSPFPWQSYEKTSDMIGQKYVPTSRAGFRLHPTQYLKQSSLITLRIRGKKEEEGGSRNQEAFILQLPYFCRGWTQSRRYSEGTPSVFPESPVVSEEGLYHCGYDRN